MQQQYMQERGEAKYIDCAIVLYPVQPKLAVVQTSLAQHRVLLNTVCFIIPSKCVEHVRDES